MQINWQWKMICYYYDRLRKTTNELVDVKVENEKLTKKVENLENKILNMQSDLVVSQEFRKSGV